MHPSRAFGFEWDEANEAHLALKGITPDEVEQVFDNIPVWLPNKRAGSGDWLMVGRTNGGRWLSIVVQTLAATRYLRAFTGLPSSEHQRQIYRRQRGTR